MESPPPWPRSRPGWRPCRSRRAWRWQARALICAPMWARGRGGRAAGAGHRAPWRAGPLVAFAIGLVVAPVALTSVPFGQPRGPRLPLGDLHRAVGRRWGANCGIERRRPRAHAAHRPSSSSPTADAGCSRAGTRRPAKASPGCKARTAAASRRCCACWRSALAPPASARSSWPVAATPRAITRGAAGLAPADLLVPERSTAHALAYDRGMPRLRQRHLRERRRRTRARTCRGTGLDPRRCPRRCATQPRWASNARRSLALALLALPVKLLLLDEPFNALDTACGRLPGQHAHAARRAGRPGDPADQPRGAARAGARRLGAGQVGALAHAASGAAPRPPATKRRWRIHLVTTHFSPCVTGALACSERRASTRPAVVAVASK